LSTFREGRDANNLAEWPMALLSDTIPDGLKTIEFEDTIDDWESGRTLVRRVCITGSDKYGLPTAKDEEVLLALLQLTKLQNDFQSPEVTFCKNQIVALLGWERCGWAFHRIEEALHRWKGTSIHYWNSWRDHRNKQWKNSEALGVIEYVHFSDARITANDGDVRSRFVWNKAFFDSFQAGYLRKLDFGIFRSLSRPAAKRAFRFLGKRFHLSPEWEFDLRLFACEKLGFSREYDTGQLKERLRPALGELEKIGFIKPVEYKKSRPKVWTIKVEQGKNAKRKKSVSTDEPSSVVAELISRGVAAETARRLAEELPEADIRAQMEAFDQLLVKSDKRVAKNPPGFLVSAISRRFEWKPAEKTHRDLSRKRTEPQESIEAAIDPQTEAWRQHLANLSPDERSRLEVDALTSAGRMTVESYHRLQSKGGQLFTALQEQMLIDYLQRTASPTSPTETAA
jgi:hypothetical protein